MFKNFFSEFRKFAEQGSAIDMAVGIIVGSAMTTVVQSLVKDIIMPPIGLLLGRVDFSALSIHLGGTASIGIGSFMNALVSFVLTLFAIFLFVRVTNTMRSKTITTRTCPYCQKADVNVHATKCPYCCAVIKPQKEVVEEAEISFKKLGDIIHHTDTKKKRKK